MKRIVQAISDRLRGKSEQERLIDFVLDEKNQQKAVDGSMEKRNELIERANLKEKRI